MIRSAALLALLLAPAALSAQDTQWNRYTLEDLDGVFVRAEAATACEAAGISVAELQASATATLEDAEVQLLTEEAMLEAPGLPELRISVDCAERGGSMAFAVSLRVQQAAQMIRDPQVTLPEAVTWYATSVGVAEADRTSRDVDAALGSRLDEFAAAWSAANAEVDTPGL